MLFIFLFSYMLFLCRIKEKTKNGVNHACAAEVRSPNTVIVLKHRANIQNAFCILHAALSNLYFVDTLNFVSLFLIGLKIHSFILNSGAHALKDNFYLIDPLCPAVTFASVSCYFQVAFLV